MTKAGPSESALNILSTDYDTYSILYGCSTVKFLFIPILWTHNAWLLSRTPTLDEETVTMAKELLTETVPTYDWPV